MTRGNKLSGTLDWTAVMLFVALVLFGWINIYAAVYDETVKQTIWDLKLNSGRQLLFIAASAIIVVAIVVVDMRFYETFAYLKWAGTKPGWGLDRLAFNLPSLPSSPRHWP